MTLYKKRFKIFSFFGPPTTKGWLPLLYSIYYTLYTVQCIVYIVHCKIYIIRYYTYINRCTLREIYILRLLFKYKNRITFQLLKITTDFQQGCTFRKNFNYNNLLYVYGAYIIEKIAGVLNMHIANTIYYIISLHAFVYSS